MRIANTPPPGSGFSAPVSKNRPASAPHGAEETGDAVLYGASSGLSLPELLKLTSAENPQRESFLAALSESLRAGLRVTDPAAAAASILRRGFDVQGHGE